MTYVDLLIFILLRIVLALLNALPFGMRVSVALLGIKIFARYSKNFDRIARINLSQVFPEKSEAERERILSDSKRSLARFIVDSARIHTLDEKWVREHIECPFKEEYLKIKERSGGRGILTASGHLGSIELQAFTAPFVGRTFSFVARSLNSERLDRWWRERHERFGNQVISRSGAVAKMIRNLSSGVDVAILIDQNVRRTNAVFVDWFGREAATTFAVAHAVLKTGAPVVISSITYLGDEKYRVNERECDLGDILNDESLDEEGKIKAITQRVSSDYQRMILENPSEWFWMHRRWRTTPEGVSEDFYS